MLYFVVCMQVAYSSYTNLLGRGVFYLGRNLSTISRTLLLHLLDQISLQECCDLHQFRVSMLVVCALSFYARQCMKYKILENTMPLLER